MEEDQSEDCIYKKIEELSIPILQSITSDEIEHFRPYNLRYYEDKYCVSFYQESTRNLDVLLRFHSNRLILISIAEGHDVFRQKKVIEKINFNVDGVDMLEISLSGKKKHGAKKLKKISPLCYLKCQDDEEEYPVYTCVPSFLIELNKHVIENPQLLVTDYKGLGYIGVLKPKWFGPDATAVEKMINKLSLLTEEQYQKHLCDRVKSEVKSENLELKTDDEVT